MHTPLYFLYLLCLLTHSTLLFSSPSLCVRLLSSAHYAYSTHFYYYTLLRFSTHSTFLHLLSVPLRTLRTLLTLLTIRSSTHYTHYTHHTHYTHYTHHTHYTHLLTLLTLLGTSQSASHSAQIAMVQEVVAASVGCYTPPVLSCMLASPRSPTPGEVTPDETAALAFLCELADCPLLHSRWVDRPVCTALAILLHRLQPRDAATSGREALTPHATRILQLVTTLLADSVQLASRQLLPDVAERLVPALANVAAWSDSPLVVGLLRRVVELHAPIPTPAGAPLPPAVPAQQAALRVAVVSYILPRCPRLLQDAQAAAPVVSLLALSVRRGSDPNPRGHIAIT